MSSRDCTGSTDGIKNNIHIFSQSSIFFFSFGSRRWWYKHWFQRLLYPISFRTWPNMICWHCTIRKTSMYTRYLTNMSQGYLSKRLYGQTRWSVHRARTWLMHDSSAILLATWFFVHPTCLSHISAQVYNEPRVWRRVQPPHFDAWTAAAQSDPFNFWQRV